MIHLVEILVFIIMPIAIAIHAKYSMDDKHDIT